jgi:predicted nucleic acid-binding protein
VILTDTGPLIALLDKRQQHHEKCRAVFDAASLPLVTTWCCFTEAMYFAQREGGAPFQRMLWTFVSEGILQMYQPADTDDNSLTEFLDQMRLLMEQYADLPMDLADASLVVTAGRLNTRTIFTLDKRDFLIYPTG